MNPWFIWKDKTSTSMGLWVSKLPDIIRPEERVQKVSVPGKAGELTLLEGDEVFESYTRTITVQMPNEHYTEELLNWLRGEGDLIVCTEPQMAYKARIAAQVVWSRLGNSLMQGKIVFDCQPFKTERYPNGSSFTATNGMTIRNRGNVSSKPKLTVTASGALTIGIADRSMAFEHFPVNAEIDCDAGIITTKAKAYSGSAFYYAGDYCIYQGGATGQYEYGLYRFLNDAVGSSNEWEYISNYVGVDYVYPWPGKWTGEYLTIPTGQSQISISGSGTVVVDPQWRWV